MDRGTQRAGFVLSGMVWAVVAGGCLSPGKLENKAAFRALLHADGGLLSKSARDAGGHAGAGTNPSKSDAGAGCPAACDLMKTRCASAGCHAKQGAQSGLDLESMGLVARVSGASAKSSACSGKLLLDPSAPDHSLLYAKLTDPPACGSRMPLGAALAASDIDCMKRFVAKPSCDAPTSPGTIDDDAGSGSTMKPATMTPGSTSMTPADNGKLRIEAESAGTITDPLSVQQDAMASGGSFISVPLATMAVKNDNPATAGVASYIFNLSAAGKYKLWGRVRVPGTESDSFWVRIDGGSWTQWNNIPADTAWHWDDVHDTNNMDTVVTFDLKAGQHTLNFAYRESGTDLDEFLFTNDLGFVPTGDKP